MKKLAVLVITLMLIPVIAMAIEPEIMTTTYSDDWTVTSSIATSTEAGTGNKLYAARISVRDNVQKKSVAGWTQGQVSSTPDLAGVAGGVTYWSSTPSTNIKEAYTAMINEGWKVAKVCAGNTAGLVSMNGVKNYDTSTGTITINLTTGTLPTATWPES